MPAGEADLIVDFGQNAATINALGGSVQHAFQHLHHAPSWRSVTLIGTSIPENYSGYEAGVHMLPRIEWDMWKKIVGMSLSYKLDFGDYATVSPVAAPPGVTWGYPINVKYTLTPEFLVCKGVGTIGKSGVEADLQLLGHAQTIAKHPARTPLAHCWADGTIDRIATEKMKPGSLETWVQIGVNRHLERTRVDLP
jgi:hypothetical protein